MITLPTKIGPPTITSPRTLILYGQHKIGKTTEVAKLPKSLIVSLDPAGAEHLSCCRIQLSNILELREVVGQLKTTTDYDYIIYDSISKMQEWCEIYATARYKAFSSKFTGESVAELPEGYGYQWIRQDFTKLFDALCEQKKAKLIFIGHLKLKHQTIDGEQIKVDKKNIGLPAEIEGAELALTGQLRAFAARHVDTLGLMYRKDEKLRVRFNPSSDGGSRFEYLAGKDIEFNWETIFPKV